MSGLFVVLALLTFSSMSVVPQSKTQETPRAAVTNAKLLNITGMTFDEKLFVTEQDMKIWTVTNPMALKGHAGQHVTITAQVDIAKNTLVVKSIKVVPAMHKMPSNDDFRDPRLDSPREPFPDYLRRREIPIK
jgi:hypothetical protein